MSVIVSIIVWLVIGGLVWWLIGMLPIDAKLKQIIQVLMIVLFILLLVGLLYGSVPLFPVLRG